MHPISTWSSTPKQSDWKSLVAKYRTAHTWKGIWQLCNSLIPFIVIWYLMVLSLDLGYWLTLLLSLTRG